MSKNEVLAELPRLTPEERQQIRQRLAELDNDDWLDQDTLTEAEKMLIEERLRDAATTPRNSIPWEEARARLKALFIK